MSIIDRILSRNGTAGHAPVSGNWRESASRGKFLRELDGLFSSGGYAAAVANRMRKDYRDSVGSGSFLLSRNRDALVRFSRALDMNTTVMPAFVLQLTNLVVGPGLIPAAAGDSPASEAVEYFIRWANDPARCHYRRLFTFWDLQRLMYREKLVAGESMAIFVDDGSLQDIESERLGPSGVTTPKRTGKNTITEGIETDDSGRIVAYHVASWSSDGASVEWNHRPIIAENVAHVANRTRLSMLRGVPVFAPALERMAMLEENHDAVHGAMKIAAMFGLFVTSESPAQAKASFVRGSETAVAADGTSYARDLASVGRGAIGFLGPNENVVTVQGSQPTSGYDSFTSFTLRLIAATVGLPVEMGLLDNSKANYSTSRMAELQAQNTAEPDRRQFQRQLCEWAYERVIRRAILTGELPARSLSDYLDVSWMPPPRRMIDPTKEIDSAVRAFDNNLDTKQDWLRQHGRDWEQIVRDREAEKQDETNSGITPPLLPGSVPQTESPALTE